MFRGATRTSLNLFFRVQKHWTPNRTWSVSGGISARLQGRGLSSRIAMSQEATAAKRSHPKKKQFRKRTKRERGTFQGTTEDVLLADVADLLKSRSASEEPNQVSGVAKGSNAVSSPPAALPERFSEIDVKIETVSSTGDGLGFSDSQDHVYVVPFTVPGDLARAKMVTHFEDDKYSLTDLVNIKEPGPTRDDSLVRCQYFSKCSGCQFQMLSYERQLAHKRRIVENAYRHFSNLTPESIPKVLDTMASPLQYGYRTKLTPHFDGPPNARKDKKAGVRPKFTEVPPIGFMLKGTRRTLDIEDCPIATPAIREGLRTERARVRSDIDKYVRGATLLLRESSTIQTPAADTDGVDGSNGGNGDSLVKTCITDNAGTSREYIGDFVFENPAGAFFQNNNSILPEFTAYVRELVTAPFSDDNTPSASSTTQTPSSLDSGQQPALTHLIDAYCGSGLFTVCLSPLGLISTGIDISSSSIEFARRNATLNNLSAESTSFMAADAAAIFAGVRSDPARTVVIIDPPRKGCDESFLSQLLDFGPRRIVYVSCNVHTQARDVAVLVEGKRRLSQGEQGQAAADKEPVRGTRIDTATTAEPTTRYNLRSLRGLDFFPQTGHVEGVALLDRV